MAILKKIGKKLRIAKKTSAKQGNEEPLVVTRFTTLPVSEKFTDTPYIPYSQQFKGVSNKEVYIVDKDVLKPESKGTQEKDININIKEEGVEDSIEEEIAKKKYTLLTRMY